MGALSDSFWLQLARFSASLEPSLVAAYLIGLEEIRKRIPTAEVERLINIGDAVGVATAVLSTSTMRHAFLQFRSAIRDAIATAATRFARDVPPTRTPGGILRVAFDELDPRTVKAVTSFERAVLAESGKTIKGAIVKAVEDGLKAGINPRTIARGIRDVVGLTPTQEVWVRHFRDQLIRGDAAVFERELLDKRFLASIRKAFAGDGLTAEQIDRMVANYRRRMIAYHAETAARTVAINSMKLGQLQIWQQSIEQGVVDEADLEREWRATPDNRTRATHRALNGNKIPFNGQWYVPGVGYVSYPGEKEYNCRCADIIRVKRKAAAA